MKKIITFVQTKFFERKLTKALSLSKNTLAWKTRKTWEDLFLHSHRMFQKSISYGVYDELILESLLLHDIVEDSHLSIEDIKNDFHSQVCFIVDGMTCIHESGEKIQKNNYFDKFRYFAWEEWRILFVKLFDSIDNLETLWWLSQEKKVKFIKEKKEIYLPIFEANIKKIPFDFRENYKKVLAVFSELVNKNYEKYTR